MAITNGWAKSNPIFVAAAAEGHRIANKIPDNNILNREPPAFVDNSYNLPAKLLGIFHPALDLLAEILSIYALTSSVDLFILSASLSNSAASWPGVYARSASDRLRSFSFNFSFTSFHEDFNFNSLCIPDILRIFKRDHKIPLFTVSFTKIFVPFSCFPSQSDLSCPYHRIRFNGLNACKFPRFLPGNFYMYYS